MKTIIKNGKIDIRQIIYAIVIIICIVAVGTVVYTQFFKEEKIGVILGITSEEKDEEYNELKENLLGIFDNNMEVVQDFTENVEKIKKDKDLIILGVDNKMQEEYYDLDLKIPYFNINSNVTKQINKKIKSIFKDEPENVILSNTKDKIIYNVKYKAYLNNNILSLIILSELKEGDNSERIIIKTYNYDMQNEKEVTINEIINEKNIDVSMANEKIEQEINKSQEQNIKLSELGYNVTVRDTKSAMYKIENSGQFFLGKNGYLYIIYPYGNKEYTSEYDLVIFR